MRFWKYESLEINISTNKIETCKYNSHQRVPFSWYGKFRRIVMREIRVCMRPRKWGFGNGNISKWISTLNKEEWVNRIHRTSFITNLFQLPNRITFWEFAVNDNWLYISASVNLTQVLRLWKLEYFIILISKYKRGISKNNSHDYINNHSHSTLKAHC